MSQRLPARPHFDLLRRRAKDVLRVGRSLYPAWRLADAQQALARGYGFASWGDLKRDVMLRREPDHAGGDDVSGEPTDPISPSTPAMNPACLAGHWLSQIEATRDRVALEIVEGDRSLLLKQVIAKADGLVVAGTLTIRPDGREHRLDVADDLRLLAAWSDLRTLQTSVRRGGVIVAEGTYAVSPDGNTMTVTVSGQCHIFTRSGKGLARRTERRPNGRGVRQSNRLALVIMMAAIAASCACASVTSRGATRPGLAQEDRDKRAIEILNRHDIAAGLAGDVDAVIAQWTDDFVLLPAAGPIVRGKAANAAMVEPARQLLEKFEPVAYEVQFEEIRVAGDYAFAWGTFRSVARVRETASDRVSSGKLLRIYQRQPDGRWLMHRTMSTVDPPPQLQK